MVLLNEKLPQVVKYSGCHIASVTDAKMMAVNERPFNNKIPLKANARHTKNKASDQPDKFVWPATHNKILATAKIAETEKNTIDFVGITITGLLIN